MNNKPSQVMPGVELMMLNDQFAVTEEDVSFFRTHGFLVLRSFFSDETIRHMQEIASGNVEAPKNNYGSGFSKLKYDVGNDDPFLLEMMQDAHFADTMLKLTGQDLFFTQGLGFELEKQKSSGFPWHVGTQSFGFQRRNDPGYTIWTPLCEIDPEKQRGGMAYVSKDVLSGEFVYQHINMLPSFIKSRMEQGENFAFEHFSELKNGLLNSPEMDALLEHFAIEDRFQIGDAFIFDKFVMHRSVRLEDGPIPSRLAYALRFSGTNARYDKTRVDALTFPRRAFNYNVGSSFNDDVASSDGDSIHESPYFKATRDRRTISRSGKEVASVS